MSTRQDGSVQLTVHNDEFPSLVGRALNPALRYALVPLRSYFTKPAPQGPQIGKPPSWLNKRHSIVKRPHEGGWNLYDITPRSSTRTPQDDSDLARIANKRRCIYFHGGAYIRPVNGQHWSLIATLSSRLMATITVVLYPLLPHNTADDTIPHFLPIYKSVREDAGTDGKVIVAGDSVGGSFALIMAHLISEAGTRVKAPDYVLLISPLLDVTGSNPEIAKAAQNDPWLTPSLFTGVLRNWRGTYDLKHPHISPIYGDIPALAKMDIHLGLVIGTYDILEPDCRRLRDLARKSGLSMDYLEWHGKPHVFPLFFSQIPEAAVAVEWIIQKLERALA